MSWHEKCIVMGAEHFSFSFFLSLIDVFIFSKKNFKVILLDEHMEHKRGKNWHQNCVKKKHVNGVGII